MNRPTIPLQFQLGVVHLALEQAVGEGVLLVVLQLVAVREEAVGLVQAPMDYPGIGPYFYCTQLNLSWWFVLKKLANIMVKNELFRLEHHEFITNPSKTHSRLS